VGTGPDDDPGRVRYPPIGDYALIGDCHAAALVSRAGSVDWCCLPRLDHGACFARLLDWDGGGHWTLAAVAADATTHRSYVDDTLVLRTLWRTDAGEAEVLDCLATPRHAGEHGCLLRVVRGLRGLVELRSRLAVRFDYGALPPWVRRRDRGLHTLSGGDDGLLVSSDVELSPDGRHDLEAVFSLRAGEHVRFSLAYAGPPTLERTDLEPPTAEDLDRRLEETLAFWRDWSAQVHLGGPDAPGVVRSAIVLKALANPSTGAIAAAPTTSLPEAPGGSLNWDYRYSWIRDSAFSARSFADVGCRDEADAFRRFVERSAAGSADHLQIMYGMGGERRLTEHELDHAEGYRGARPVRVGNAAVGQLQLDAYGELVELAWRWHERGRSLDDDYWRFLLDLVDAAATRSKEPDHGLWEIRGEPQHFVHSKVMCWAALDRGIRMAEESLRQAPVDRWRRRRSALRRSIEREGYDEERGIFLQAFGSDRLDAALLLLPVVGFVAWDDERMVRTADAIQDELGEGGLLLRYRTDPGANGSEGAFLACSFWLAECFTRQGRVAEGRAVFDRSVATGNELGLFSEEFDVDASEMLGNFPQGLTHLSHISAAVALAERPVLA